MLQSSLAASHQRIVALTADMNLGSSTPSSPQPFTPTKDYADLLATDGMTPLSAIGAIGEEEYGSGDGTRELAVESSRQRQGAFGRCTRSNQLKASDIPTNFEARQEHDAAAATQQLEL
jgi:hypothetical protein